ncbi:unnamed protein product [Didymodactylos carnosus]|uniref:Uncharacterized protein n=1 Tax=Didymodactylos carnosus TaxID=1234261 RepID=A0A815RC05_9BILA|nr:unnamed protein product [Didymodactylos carnosus]CAF1474733.1 unnamed protein product [Didymodactylos carnosus]CAF3989201.1 unnamed protein product [Didymodactylos carnosus]CAF4341284.1 unnamed protein product [Didymodactylos carnosus]
MKFMTINFLDMRVCSIRKLFYIRYAGKRHRYIFHKFTFALSFIVCCFSLSSIIYIIYLTPTHDPLFGTYNSCLIENLLAYCMSDSTPCRLDIDKAVDHYFKTLKNKFSMLLTYHPIIDCENGRYLLLNDSLTSHVWHGTGSQLMWYLGIINIAYSLNLTLIHLDWGAEHTDQENNLDREKYWQFFDWEIPYSAYLSCPENSSVKQNIFIYDLMWNQTYDQHHFGKQPYTIKSHFKTLFDNFTNNLKNNSKNIDKKKHNGFTLFSRQTFTITSSLMETGVVFEIRWWLQHRKLFNEYTGVWAGIPVLSNYLPTDYFQYIITNNNTNKSTITNDLIQSFKPIQCSSINVHDILLIGVHIRHGDVIKRTREGRISSIMLNRYVANSAYIPLIIFIINALPLELRAKNNYLITIYSEGIINDFNDILIDLQKALPNSRCRLSFFLNGRTSETFNRLLREDILIGGLSTFSMATGIFNSRQLKLMPYHNQARVHGMRNYLSLGLNKEHTQFRITKDKQHLIRQRIEYVWQQKQAQQSTSTPLWLNNYSQDYPEEYMLI